MNRFVEIYGSVRRGDEPPQLDRVIEGMKSVGDVAEDDGALFATPTRVVESTSQETVVILCGTQPSFSLPSNVSRHVRSLGIGRIVQRKVADDGGLAVEPLDSWLGADESADLSDWVRRLENEVNRNARRFIFDPDGVEVMGKADHDTLVKWHPIAAINTLTVASTASHATTVIRFKTAGVGGTYYAGTISSPTTIEAVPLTTEDGVRLAFALRVSNASAVATWLPATESTSNLWPLYVNWSSLPSQYRRIRHLGVSMRTPRSKYAVFAFDDEIRPIVNHVLTNLGIRIKTSGAI